MRKEIISPSRETQWAPGSRLVLVAAILFLALNVAHLAYRMTIPSLGWSGKDPESSDIAKQYFELDTNAVGYPSLLQSGDKILSIGGITAKQVLDNILVAPKPSNWQIGKTVQLTVLRGEQTLMLDVPITHWTPSAWWLTNFGNFDAILSWLMFLLLFGVGTFTFIKRPGNLSARFLFAFGLANLSIALGESILDFSALYFDLTAGLTKLIFSNVVFAYLIAPSYLGYALTFPKPKSIIQRQPRWLLLPFLIGLVPTILLFIDPQFAEVGFMLTLVMILLGVIALIHSGLTMRDAVSRAQLRWAIGGFITGSAVFLLNFIGNLPSPYREMILFVASLGLPIMGFSLAIAIFRYRLFDIDVIIRKTLQYTILTVFLALIYFGSVILLQGLVENLTGEQSPIVIVLSTLGIAALFNPLRNRTQDFIDHRFYRKKYNAEQALAHFAVTARDEVDIQKLSSALVNLMDETMQPGIVNIWLRPTQKVPEKFIEQESLQTGS